MHLPIETQNSAANMGYGPPEPVSNHIKPVISSERDSNELRVLAMNEFEIVSDSITTSTANLPFAFYLHDSLKPRTVALGFILLSTVVSRCTNFR